MRRSNTPVLRRPWILIVALLVLATACAESAPTDLSQGETEAALTAAAAPQNAIATVKGAGHYQLNDPPAFVGDFKWIYRFSVNATKYASGADVGTVKFRSHVPPGQNNAGFPGEWTADVTLDCIEVVGNTAWLSGPITKVRTSSPFGPPVGDIAMLIVRDNGNTDADEVNVGPVGSFGATDCRDMPPIFPGAFTDGNLKVN